MTTPASQPHESSFPAAGSTLALLTVPYVYTQDGLLSSGDFLKEAERRGHQISLRNLEILHERGLLRPLYRVDDTPVPEHQIGAQSQGFSGMRGQVLAAAADGRVVDPADEPYSAEWAYERPDAETGRDWWNGFAYSPWQLFDLDFALIANSMIEEGRRAGDLSSRTDRNRRLSRALAALSVRSLSGVLGQMKLPPGVDEEGFWRFRSESDPVELLRLAGFDPADLLKEAEWLLLEAHSKDPLVEWLELLRHSNSQALDMLKGEALACHWRRIGAELLLRAHEDLAATGQLEPLPDISGVHAFTALHDRLTPRHDDATTLERALGTFGLSPHPRVLLLVEGETELIHIPRLLAEFGLGQPQKVRVQSCGSSRVNPQLIARYNVTPRIGRRYDKMWLLDATPTALVIAMDPENDFATQVLVDAKRKDLQEAIAKEVRAQGADIAQEDLDYLVSIHVWGEDKYELANFTDDELVPAVMTIARQQAESKTGSSDLADGWEAEFRRLLAVAREGHLDIKRAIGPMKLGEPKTKLAEILWSTLLAKCERELSAGQPETPVLKLVLEVRKKVAMLSGGGYSLRVPDGFDGE